MTFKGGSYTLRSILVPIFRNGKCVYDSPSVAEIRDYCLKEQESLYRESRRLINAQTIPVDLSQKLWDMKQNMMHEYGKSDL